MTEQKLSLKCRTKTKDIIYINVGAIQPPKSKYVCIWQGFILTFQQQVWRETATLSPQNTVASFGCYRSTYSGQTKIAVTLKLLKVFT